MLDILLVCTANQCRSPMAEAILGDRMAGRGIAAHVHSAGLYPGGQPATEDAQATARAAGLDLSRHRSTEISADLVRGADLVVAMARAHSRELIVLAPDAWTRIFTLKELVRTGHQRGGRASGQPLDEWLEGLSQGRDRAGLLVDDPEDDIADPIGLGLDAYQRTYQELAGLLDHVVALIGAEPGPLDRSV